MAKLRKGNFRNNSIFTADKPQSYSYKNITEIEMRQWYAGGTHKDKDAALAKKAQQAVKILEEKIKNGDGVEPRAGRDTRYDSPVSNIGAVPGIVMPIDVDFEIPRGS